MATQTYTDGVTLSSATEFNRFDTIAYSVLSGVAGTNTITATGPANYTYLATRPPVWFIPAVTNTGATTINITPSGGAALGARNLFSGGIACVGGELVAGVPASAIDDGTRLHLLTRAFFNLRVLGKSGAAVSAPADTTEDTLATITIPANALGANGILRITTTWTYTNSANNKTLRVRYSGAAGSQYMSAVRTTHLNSLAITNISNRNATNSQVGNTDENTNTAAIVLPSPHITSAVDTTAATTIVITGQKASAGETLTLESYLVELIADGT